MEIREYPVYGHGHGKLEKIDSFINESSFEEATRQFASEVRDFFENQPNHYELTMTKDGYDDGIYKNVSFDDDGEITDAELVFDDISLKEGLISYDYDSFYYELKDEIKYNIYRIVDFTLECIEENYYAPEVRSETEKYSETAGYIYVKVDDVSEFEEKVEKELEELEARHIKINDIIS